ncbi:MAG: Rieske 2Fe-2S domain-containing protein [Bdellovibrionaceae bacterium]|nr:Rieske 2Fe-2S domain-containing protein [Pseudobdellovibrionaceae bacterium]
MEIQREFIKNQNSQPTLKMPVFNNAAVVAEGWYFVMPARSLKPKKIHSFSIGYQDLVVWRTETGKLGIVDAYCPHMGTHLGKGTVKKETIQCFFHHWKFDSEGHCQDIPADPTFCRTVKTKSYAVMEQFESIWVFPKSQAPHPLAHYPELEGLPLYVTFGKTYQRRCHHHVTMINGIDPQHLKTVHQINIEMSVDIKSTARQMQISLAGAIGNKTWASRITQFFIGPLYSYSMLYDHASNGFLTLVKNSFWFGGKKKIPSMYMIFAYRPLAGGHSQVQPIFLTPKRTGVFGILTSRILIWITQMGFRALQGEDGEVYENMRFNPNKLLPMDRPVGQYIQYVNKIPISLWGKPS